MSCSKGYRIAKGLAKEDQYREIRRGLGVYMQTYEGLDFVARMSAINVYLKAIFMSIGTRFL
jgi:hypothetical protein